MKIVIAPDSFKESLSAKEVAQAIAQGVSEAIPSAEIVTLPLADGGEGSLDALLYSCQGERQSLSVTGPIGLPTVANWGKFNNGQLAVIEMAQASGLEKLTDEQKNPLISTTFGTGELIKAALDSGVTKLLICLGGSATNDAGAGMLQALGARLLDADGQPLAFGGAALAKLHSVDLSQLDSRLKSVAIEVACDVVNPLYGEHGASYVFGAQKGASAADMACLDAALKQFADCIEAQLGKSLQFEGAGAAGGLAAGLSLLPNVTFQSGIDLMLNWVGFDEQLHNVDWVISGEGRVDGQSAQGKTPMGVAKRAISVNPNIKVQLFAGSVGDGAQALYQYGVTSILGITPGAIPLQQALNDAAKNLSRTAFNWAKVVQVSQQ